MDKSGLDEYKFTTLRELKPWRLARYRDMRNSRMAVEIVLNGKVLFHAIVLDVFVKPWSEIDNFEIRMDTEPDWNKAKFEEWARGVYGCMPYEWIKMYLLKVGG